MAESSSHKATPKRKRDDIISEQKRSTLASVPTLPYSEKTIFSFESPNRSSDMPEDGNSSPRTKVAQKFRDLALNGEGSGGGVVKPATVADGNTSDEHGVGIGRPQFSPDPAVFDFDGVGAGSGGLETKMEIDDDEGSTGRKRVKIPEIRSDLAPGALGESSANAVGPVQIDGDGRLFLLSTDYPGDGKTNKIAEDGKLKKSYPSINRLADSKSRRRGRTGTPPLGSSKRKTNKDTIEEEPVIVDPIRAALTWHEDEITVYDSEDKDDDGTGLNGIGFKPTPAAAYARAQKRRQQLNEYKKREESEARARRNQRRREDLGEPLGLERKHSMAKVRFSEEVEPSTMITT